MSTVLFGRSRHILEQSIPVWTGSLKTMIHRSSAPSSWRADRAELIREVIAGVHISIVAWSLPRFQSHNTQNMLNTSCTLRA